MSEKQDRQGVRTAADLERKYQFGKQFAEIMGVALDARGQVSIIETELRCKIEEQYTKITRDTEQILMEALTKYVQTSEYEDYKQTVSAQFKIVADEISANLKSTTERITNVSNSLDSVITDLGSMTESFESLEKDLDNYSAASEEFKALVTQDLAEHTERMAGIESDLEAHYTVSSEFQEYCESEFSATAKQIEVNMEATTESFTEVRAAIEDVQGDIKEEHVYAEELRTYCESEFDATAKQIELNMTATTESFTEVRSTIEDAQGDIEEEHIRTEELRTYCESEFAATAEQLELGFGRVEERITNIDGEVSKQNEYLEKHFEFSIDGLVIKAGENSMSLALDNGLIIFRKNGQQFGWWDGVYFHTGNIVVDVTERAQFGNYAFVPRSNGSLDLLKVG